MSSPFTMPNYGVPDRGAASSPVLAPRSAQQAQTPDEAPIRPMRLKVLYTFDDQNKTNCLARWPQLLDIRTAFLDESTQIGVIELKTCLQAIVSASPELVARLGQDYTVYAYDYSEYETPLVGQGMLSWALASSSSTPTAPAHQSKTMVTGRVCKNIVGLFGNTSQETLEVKLRLVPVPTCLQSEYIESMQKYRDISKIMPEGFDMGAWTAFLQANPAIMQIASQSRSQTPAHGGNSKEGVGIEHVQRLLNQGTVSSGLVENTFGTERSSTVPSTIFEQQPRVASPALSVRSTTGPTATGPKRRGRPPKNGPKPAAPPAATQRKASTNQGPVEGGYTSSDDRFEDGPAKKRAKVTKADAPNKSNFGQQPESLRVAASTAASVRIYQPTAIHPPSAVPNTLEAPPRAPTPIADPTTLMKRPTLLTARSSLRRESFLADDSTYESPYAPSETGPKPLESILTSPEASRNGSIGDTPADISSSPPIYRGASTAPSSPRLPVMQREVDSGFMSGSVDDLFDDEELRPLDDEDLEVAAQYSKRPDLPDISTKPTEPIPTRNVNPSDQTQDHPSDKAIALSRKSARNAIGLGRTSSSGNLSIASASASDSVRPTNLHRSQTWAGHHQEHASSDIAIVDEEEGFARSDTRPRSESGTGAKRRKAIQSKLASSIAAGEMPPFCDHCGAIETPTWRKAWVKIHSGTPEHVRISDEEGGIITWQTLQTDESGVVCLYRIFKKSLLSTDEGFSEVLLCNPCGLWLHNRKCMRPKENWEKPKPNSDGKRKRRNPPKKRSDPSSEPNRGGDSTQDAECQQPENSSPAAEPSDENKTQMSPQLPVYTKPRALSVQSSPVHRLSSGMDSAAATAALQRAIQSSPARVVGTKQDPIQIGDLTPRPTRRVLFPSPSKSEEAILNHASLAHVTRGGYDEKKEHLSTTAPADDNQADKENRPPPEDGNEALDDLFGEDSGTVSRPTTPTPSSKLHGNTFKTPKNLSTPHKDPPMTGDFFSSTAKALLHQPRTPKRASSSSIAQPLGDMTPFTAHLNQLFSEANGSPSGNYDFPSLPSIHNTPDRLAASYSFAPFDSQDFFSTDVPMPSSPPIWFGVYEDAIEQDSSGPSSDQPLPELRSPPADEDETTVKQGKNSKSSSLVVDDRGYAGVGFAAIA